MNKIPKLAPPGAGIPAYQRLTGKYILLPLYCRRLTWEGAVDLLEQEARKLVGLSAGLGEERLSRRILVPPQIGLEDSSRYWSYAMVLEHLAIMGRAVTEVIVELTHGRTRLKPVRTADLKPVGRQDAAEAIEEFDRLTKTFRRRALGDIGNQDSPTRFKHPWFGPLTARQWISFVPFHQRIHIRQAKRILLP